MREYKAKQRAIKGGDREEINKYIDRKRGARGQVEAKE